MKIPESLCKDNILKYIDDKQIFERYIGHKIEVRELYLSPLRKEATPSFNFFINRNNGRLWFKDFGGVSGDCFRLIELLESETFMEVLARVNFDFNLGLGSAFETVPTTSKITQTAPEPKDVNIEVKIQNHTYQDLQYWKQYSITKKLLNQFRVFSIASVWINGYQVNAWEYNIHNPIYGYLLKGKWKLYRPLETNKADKWRSNLPYNYWLGLAQLPKNGAKTLIISKGYKDVIVLRQLGLYAVAVSGETASFPLALLDWFKKRFENIIIWYDNDEVGIKAAEEKAVQHGLSFVHNPIDEPKDTSDYVKEYGIEAGKELLYELNILQ